jgi:multidrug efflux pump subunit AcrA (membrane-fusion protein)
MNETPSPFRRDVGSAECGAARVVVIVGIVLLLLAALAAGARWHAELAGMFGGNAAANGKDARAPRQLWTCGMHPQVIQDHPGDCPICHMKLTPLAATSTASLRGEGAERAVAYWWDPMMNPPYVSDHPGKSPMGMDLVPVLVDDVSAGASVTIDPVVVQNMGVRTATVVEGPLARTVRAVGFLDEPEPNHVDINLRVSGWIEKLHADTEGMPVGKGEPLFDLYSPELQTAIEDLIAARKARDGVPARETDARGMADVLYGSIEKKLELLGLDPSDVGVFARAEHAPATVTFRSPMDGHLTEKMVYAGAAVKAGERIMRIANRATMWLELRVFERDMASIQVGTHVRASVESMPGRILAGDVLFVHPHIDPQTRTALVRVVLPNPGHELRQGMFATGEIDALIAERAVLVPREAVIDTGERQIAFVVRDHGRFDPRRVTLGARGSNGPGGADVVVQVLSGLAPGEQVVTSGQLLLDAESRMREAIQKHLDEGLLDPKAGAGRTESAASVPARSAPAAAGPDEAPKELLDAVYGAYLGVARALGAVQSGDAPVDAGALIAAAKSFADSAGGATRVLAAAVRDAAAPLAGRSLDQQRDTMKSLGPAMIALADHAPPSRSVAEKLYVLRCTMAPGDWLQNVPEVQNPFYGRAMKTCGEVLRTIDGAQRER